MACTLCHPFGIENASRVGSPGCAARSWAVRQNPFGPRRADPLFGPGGAVECSHGCSGARPMAGGAEPVVERVNTDLPRRGKGIVATRGGSIENVPLVECYFVRAKEP